MKTTLAMCTLAFILWINQDISCDVHIPKWGRVGGRGINPSRGSLGRDTFNLKIRPVVCFI